MRICQLNVFIKYVKTRNVGSIMSISSKRTILLYVIFVGLGVPVVHEISFGTFNIWKRYCSRVELKTTFSCFRYNNKNLKVEISKL